VKKIDDGISRSAIAGRGEMPAAPMKVIAEHTIVKGDTLSGIAKKYYGSSDRKYYMYIYNRNKDVIGKDPDKIMIGMKLKIFEFPS